VLWVTTKATQLEAALELAPPDHVGRAVVVPLLNGIEHVPTLRARYGRLLAAVFYGESERIEPGLVHQPTPFANVVLGPGPRREEIVEELRTAGLDAAVESNEPALLWRKLVMLAPLALTTTALGAPVGVVQADADWHRRLLDCHDEAVAIAVAEGAKVDPPRLREALLGFAGGEMRTSMQKDLDAGRPLELDAIAGPILRGGQRHRIATPTTEELVRLVEVRQVPTTARIDGARGTLSSTDATHQGS
jgi:2-dehydropantoate 2-reductase